MLVLTVEKIIEIQTDLISESECQEDQGTGGILRDRGTLEYLVYRGNSITNIFQKAAWMLHGIATTHPFFQGNKRTAFMVAYLILDLLPEPYVITASDEAINQFVRDVANSRYSRADVEKWLQTAVKKEI